MQAPKSPPPTPTASDLEALAQGLRQFNTWRFWDCHETLEDLWREEQAPLANFYQGLIKLAAGFHHLLRGNHHGAVTLLAGGLQLLEPFRPAYLGVDVEKLLTEARRCYDTIVALGAQRLSEFDRTLIPTIHGELVEPIAFHEEGD